jgi:caa(3)-type oxidase subunit IV
MSERTEDDGREKLGAILRRTFFVWIALMLLLALTVGATLAPIGAAKGSVNLLVSLAKAGLITWIFMQLRARDGLVRIAGFAAAGWLVILFGYVSLDILTR